MPARTHSGFQMRKCQSETCGLRYPCLENYTLKDRCPRCGAPAAPLLDEDTGSREADSYLPVPHRLQLHLEALLDNIRSAWNVGSIFRSADGAGLSHLYLCGFTPTPEFPAVLKTSLGAEKSLPWTQHLDGFKAATGMLQQGRHLWALENDPSASSIYTVDSLDTGSLAAGALVLVVGNEITGVDPGILELCERTIYLPMHGLKRSYNVAVAFGIAAHYLGWLAGGASH